MNKPSSETISEGDRIITRREFGKLCFGGIAAAVAGRVISACSDDREAASSTAAPELTGHALLNARALSLLSNGEIKTFNELRKSNPTWIPDLRGVMLYNKDMHSGKTSFFFGTPSPSGAGITYEDRLNLRRVDLSGADLRRTNFAYAIFDGADLSRADLSHANLDYASIRNARLVTTNLCDTRLFVDLSGSDLRGASLRDASLSNPFQRRNNRGWSGRSASLSGADLSDVDFRGADLRGVDITYADIRGADFSGSDLRYVKGNDPEYHD